MTYPDPAVRQALAARFVALRLDHRDPHVRELNVVWLPTLFVADARGVIHYRNVNSIPPELLLDVLDLGEAHARLRQAAYDVAEGLLRAALDRRDDGPLTPELLYWSGIARYFAGDHDDAARDDAWRHLRDRYPDSVWTYRIP